jgi:hypothetical protein
VNKKGETVWICRTQWDTRKIYNILVMKLEEKPLFGYADVMYRPPSVSSDFTGMPMEAPLDGLPLIVGMHIASLM